MVKKRELTEKKMKNKAFCKRERAIFLAYFKMRDYPNAKKLSKRAKISRQTFYNHHSSPQMIPYDYEKYLLDAFRRKIRRYLKDERYELKTIFARTLVFIHNNRETLIILFKDGRKNIVDEIMNYLKPRIIREWNYAGDFDELYRIYAKEISGVIENWARKKFSNKELDKILNDIMYLTVTSVRRLNLFID